MDSLIVPFRQPPSHEDAQGRVRELARNTANIFWSEHAQQRMNERDIIMREALGTIRRGRVDGKIVPDGENRWKMTLRRRFAGRTVKVVIAVSDHDDNLDVITVM
ncbi:MAG: DUF4258 domain-containing protein [Gammaproteobacteria bacterium]|nr:DUF4258 domain-containing protein [Gammaproteobacteria bacterium]